LEDGVTQKDFDKRFVVEKFISANFQAAAPAQTLSTSRLLYNEETFRQRLPPGVRIGKCKN
jgi:hypothetical protein